MCPPHYLGMAHLRITPIAQLDGCTSDSTSSYVACGTSPLSRAQARKVFAEALSAVRKCGTAWTGETAPASDPYSLSRYEATFHGTASGLDAGVASGNAVRCVLEEAVEPAGPNALYSVGIRCTASGPAKPAP
jgi:hypothetical protein